MIVLFPVAEMVAAILSCRHFSCCLGINTTFIFFWLSPEWLRIQHIQSQMQAFLSWDSPPDLPWHCSPGLELRNNLLFSSLLLSNLSWQIVFFFLFNVFQTPIVANDNILLKLFLQMGTPAPSLYPILLRTKVSLLPESSVCSSL